MNLEDELKNLDREVERIARRKKELLLRQEAAQKAKSLDVIYEESGYASPQDLVEALIRRFGLSVTGENLLRRKRRRTRVTAGLRDSIRQDCAAGFSKNRASKKYNISYAVVSKVLTGNYDHLA
ncbi:MAG: hypothetical protein LBT98_02960 [Puniceicoccales bacterium]|jgi:AraC-like DNA-binding protein|nr:hypothetical protein [Puniceicoccales bacterium]